MQLSLSTIRVPPAARSIAPLSIRKAAAGLCAPPRSATTDPSSPRAAEYEQPRLAPVSPLLFRLRAGSRHVPARTAPSISRSVLCAVLRLLWLLRPVHRSPVVCLPAARIRVPPRMRAVFLLQATSLLQRSILIDLRTQCFRVLRSLRLWKLPSVQTLPA